MLFENNLPFYFVLDYYCQIVDFRLTITVLHCHKKTVKSTSEVGFLNVFPYALNIPISFTCLCENFVHQNLQSNCDWSVDMLIRWMFLL